MFWMLASVASAAEPCVPEFARPAASSVEVIPMGNAPDPVARRFVTGEGVDAIRGAMSGVPVAVEIRTDAVLVETMPTPRTFESVLEHGGALRGLGRELRLRGGTPMVYLNGVSLRSDLE